METWLRILAGVAIQGLGSGCAHEGVPPASVLELPQASGITPMAEEFAELEEPRFAAIVDRQPAVAAEPGRVPAAPVQLPDGSWLLAEADFTWYGLSGHARFLEFPEALAIELSFKNAGSQRLWWREITDDSIRPPRHYSYAGRTDGAGARVGGGGYGGGHGGGHPGRAPTETSRDQRQAWEFPPGATVSLLISTSIPSAPFRTSSPPDCSALHFNLELAQPETEPPMATKVSRRLLSLDWESGHQASVRDVWNPWPM